MRFQFYFLILLVFCLACNNGEPKQEKLDMTFPEVEWSMKQPESLSVNSEKMKKALDYLASEGGNDMLSETMVIRKGHVIFQGDSIHKKHNIYSSTKSFTSTVLGILYDQNIIGPETYAFEIDSSLEKRYAKVQLKHFASMTSGYSAQGDSRWGEPSQDWSPTPFAIDAPLFKAGSEFAYWDEAQMMFGRLLTMKTGQTLKEIFQNQIGNKIGIGDFEWWGDTELEGLPLNNGCTGVTISAQQLARFGHFYLNNGMWKDEQLLSEEWIRMATTNQVFTDKIADTDRNNVDGIGSYGYNWWVNGQKPDGSLHMPDAPTSLFYASGFNNNMCFVVPEWDMVIVRMGEDGNPEKGKVKVYNEFFKLFKEAIEFDVNQKKGLVGQADEFNTPDDKRLKSLEGLSDTTFVRLADYSNDFAYDMRYATTNNFLKAKVYDCAECYTRVKTAKALIAANKEFNKLSYRIKFFDCYRPNSVQYKMWELVPNPQYVANPVKGSIHNKGGAVDITLETFGGEELDMGTDFDFFGRRAHHDNTDLPEHVLANRKLLKETMEEHGFWSIRTEWWHYNLSAGSNDHVANFKWTCN